MSTTEIIATIVAVLGSLFFLYERKIMQYITPVRGMKMGAPENLPVEPSPSYESPISQVIDYPVNQKEANLRMITDVLENKGNITPKEASELVSVSETTAEMYLEELARKNQVLKQNNSYSILREEK